MVSYLDGVVGRISLLIPNSILRMMKNVLNVWTWAESFSQSDEKPQGRNAHVMVAKNREIFPAHRGMGVWLEQSHCQTRGIATDLNVN